MTMAGMLVQILYQIYAALVRTSRGGGDRKGYRAAVGLLALLFYYIGIYLVLYLSRTRKDLADAFSANKVEPRHLASALIKIAYGIVAIEDTEATQSLLRSTRHLGVIDVKNARYTGLLAAGAAAEAMLFDTYNPWAALIQLNSTHPLTGRRVAHLGEIARAKGQGFADYDVEAAAAHVHLDRGKLWGQFLGELLLLVAPLLFGLVVLGAWQLAPAAIALGVRATLPLRYPFRTPKPATVMALWAIPAPRPCAGSPLGPPHPFLSARQRKGRFSRGGRRPPLSQFHVRLAERLHYQRRAQGCGRLRRRRHRP
jgi:heat shock protein HtpX